MPEPWSVRSYRPGDGAILNAAFERVFGKPRSLEEWEWKFLRCPWGTCITLAEHASGQVLAQFAALPTPFQVEGHRFLVGQGVDAFRVELGAGAVADRELYRATARAFFREFCEKGPIQLLYGLAGRRHTKVLTEHLGWVACGTPETWVATPLSRLGAPPRALIGFHERLWGELWERSRERYRVAALRDVAFVRWRYLEHPARPYTFVLLGEPGEPTVGAVVRPREGVCYWVDLIWDGREQESLEHLALLMRRLAADWGLRRVELWLRGDPAAAEVLAAAGFARFSAWEEITVAAIAFHPELDAASFGRDMYLTFGDGDLL